LKLQLSLSVKLLSGLLLGFLSGLIFSEAALFVTTMRTLGTLFINLLQMVLIPWVFSSLVVVSASVGSCRRLGLLALKSLAYFLLTTALAVTLGLVAANLADPGQGLRLPLETQSWGQVPPPFSQALLNLIPANPFQALGSGNLLQIMVVAVLLGLGIAAAGEKAGALMSFFMALDELMTKLAHGVLRLVPWGAFALLVPAAADWPEMVVPTLVKLLAAVTAACLLHALIVYSAAVKTLTGMSLRQFFRGFAPAILVAFAARSSYTALPVSLRAAEDQLGVKKEIASFVLPLGAVVNVDGHVICQGICTVFAVQAAGLELSFSQQVTVILTAVLASLSTAGLPGASLMIQSMLLNCAGLPLAGLTLVMGLAPLLDMLAAALNATGSASAAVVLQGYREDGDAKSDE